MIELEENTRLLQLIKEKIKELGESLWHYYIRKRTRKIRTRNYWVSLLGRSEQFEESIIKNKSNKK